MNSVHGVRPDAPELTFFGRHPVGVRTMTLTDRGRPNILATAAGQPTVYYDRPLTVEIWYPAQPGQGRKPVIYRTVTRDPSVMASLQGSALRDVPAADGKYPLLIVSHGYPGNRYLLSHLGENLASKGYIVVSIDHKDSTYDDQQDFSSTLYNRPFDQAFILSAIADMGDPASDSFLSTHVDAGRTGLVGYSMGAYGVINNLGGGYSEVAVSAPGAPPNGLLRPRTAASPDFRSSLDPRIKAGVAIAPWGMHYQMWDAGGLAGVDRPTLFVAGDADEVADYDNGIRAIFEQTVNSDRYLLTFENAGHNAAAPIPLPAELAASGNAEAAGHYLDPVWDNVRMNNILDHFVTAFFDLHLKDETARRSYLDLIPVAARGVHALDEDGRPLVTHTYWKGFPPGSAIGLRMEKGDH